MPDRDPLDALRDQWQQLEPPATGGDIKNEDALTQQSVQWMQAAWSATQADAAPPLKLRRRAFLRRHPVMPRAAAAAALLAGALVAWQAFSAPTVAEPEIDNAVSAPNGRTQVPPVDLEFPQPVVLASSTPERMEFQAGNVRVTLLQPPSEPPAQTND